MKALEGLAGGGAALRTLLDGVADAVVVLDRHARLVFANSAALRLMPCQTDMPIEQWRGLLGEPAAQWLQRAIGGRAPTTPLPPARLADGRSLPLTWRPLDARHSALHIQVPAPALAMSEAALPHAHLALGSETPDGSDPLIELFWHSPFPATLQDAQFRYVDVNQAMVDFTGHPRSRLIGMDPVVLLPADERADAQSQRALWADAAADQAPSALDNHRLMDAEGRERWYRMARRRLTDGEGQLRYLSVLQDVTAEQVARERADRSVRELDDWFDLSPVGMLLYDTAGLVVRTNPAFEALAGAVPVLMSETDPALQALLAWHKGRAPAQLRPGSTPLVRDGWLPQPDGRLRRLRAIIRCYLTPSGQSRYMAVVEDRSVEEERDLAQIQMGALMDTAGVGVATFQESAGWVAQGPKAAADASAASASMASLKSISRDIVLPGSQADYDRLQQALRQGQRLEVRYAVRHPERGERWLLTRVEPGVMASGQRTTSVVTLDVTEQHVAQQRSEELLREVTTILESTTAGIAYLRGDQLVRCNRRFEAMLGLRGGVAGRTLAELFGEHPQAQRIAADTLQALLEGLTFETEFELPTAAVVSEAGDAVRPVVWYALSVRRTGPPGETMEAIAVLSDITRLKNQQAELERLARDRELMFSLSEVGISFIRDNCIQRANDALAQLAGCTVAELSGAPLGSLFVDGDDYARLWPQEEQALRAYGRWIGERQLRRRDGRRLWVQVSKRLVAEGDPAGGMIASYVNVDDRHRAEEAVALQAERTRAILDSVLVGIVTVDARGIEWMNRSARRMFGGDLADFVGQPISAVATPDADHPFRQTHYIDELVEGQAETFECRVKALDGREFWVVGNAVATGREGSERQLTYALMDIDGRRQAEARIAEAQASLQRIIEAAPLAITLRDARSLRVLQINEVAARMIGLPAPSIIDHPPEDLFEPALAERMRLDMLEALASSEVTKREYSQPLDGQMRTWDARYLPLASTGQAPDQLLLVATDVTEQRVAQQAKFEEAIAQREMLVKEVHHRIKNNLQGVAGLLQQIAARKPEVASVISEVVGQVQAIAQVYGLQVGVTGVLRVKNVVEAIIGSVQRTFGRSIRFELEGSAPHEWALPEAESIPIALTINELLTNAIKHSRLSTNDLFEGVSCTLHFSDDGVRLAIANTATLAEGFTLAGVPGGVSGLGLVRALLPRRNASLGLSQQADRVVATVVLAPPVVTRLAPV